MNNRIISPITGNDLFLDTDTTKEYAVDTICGTTAHTLNYTPVRRYANDKEELFIPI